MANAHTPGPWIAHTQRTGSALVRQYGVRPEAGKAVARIFAQSTADTQERDANARLIAAAPALLEVLERTVKAFNVDEVDPLIAFAAIEQARAAIAQVQGETR